MSDEPLWEQGVVVYVNGAGWATVKPDIGGGRVHIPASLVMTLPTGSRVEFIRVAAKQGWEASRVRLAE